MKNPTVNSEQNNNGLSRAFVQLSNDLTHRLQALGIGNNSKDLQLKLTQLSSEKLEKLSALLSENITNTDDINSLIQKSQLYIDTSINEVNLKSAELKADAIEAENATIEDKVTKAGKSAEQSLEKIVLDGIEQYGEGIQQLQHEIHLVKEVLEEKSKKHEANGVKELIDHLNLLTKTFQEKLLALCTKIEKPAHGELNPNLKQQQQQQQINEKTLELQDLSKKIIQLSIQKNMQPQGPNSEKLSEQIAELQAKYDKQEPALKLLKAGLATMLAQETTQKQLIETIRSSIEEQDQILQACKTEKTEQQFTTIQQVFDKLNSLFFQHAIYLSDIFPMIEESGIIVANLATVFLMGEPSEQPKLIDKFTKVVSSQQKPAINSEKTLREAVVINTIEKYRQAIGNTIQKLFENEKIKKTLLEKSLTPAAQKAVLDVTTNATAKLLKKIRDQDDAKNSEDVERIEKLTRDFLDYANIAPTLKDVIDRKKDLQAEVMEINASEGRLKIGADVLTRVLEKIIQDYKNIDPTTTAYAAFTGRLSRAKKRNNNHFIARLGDVEAAIAEQFRVAESIAKLIVQTMLEANNLSQANTLATTQNALITLTNDIPHVLEFFNMAYNDRIH